MRKIVIGLIVVGVLVTAAHMALPSIIRDQANKKLASLPEYEGHVGKVHIAILRGAFGLDEFVLRSKNGDMRLELESFETAIAWPHLVRRALVCSVKVTKPKLTLIIEKPSKVAEKTGEKGKEAEENVKKKTGKNIPDALADLIPFRVDRFEIENGTVLLQEKEEHAEKEGKNPEHEPFLTNLNVTVENLTNSRKLSESLVSTGKIKAKVVGSGNLDLTLHIDPLAKQPRFDLALQLEKVNLPNLNELLEWQMGLHFKKGTFALYADADAADGAFKGYLKPFIEDLEVEKPKEKEGFVVKVKEVVVNAAAKVFKNEKTEKVATKIPFEGRFDNPQAGVWDAVLTLLRNAFVEALKPRLDPGLKIKS